MVTFNTATIHCIQIDGNHSLGGGDTNYVYDHNCMNEIKARFFTGTKACVPKNNFPGHWTVSTKKCPLTNNCACWIYSQSVGSCTVEVGTCSLHVWNIPVSLITGNIWYITTAPWNGRFWVSFHLADKWCSRSSVNKKFLCKCNLGRNCKEWKKLKVIL